MVKWNDTVSGNIRSSDIEWIAEAEFNIPGATVRRKTKPRKPYDGGAFLELTGLRPLTRYRVRVRDGDLLTVTPWSDWLGITTQAGGSNNVDIIFGNGLLLSTVTPVSGAFRATVTIPSNTPPGRYPIDAIGWEESAHSGIMVLAPGQTAPPQIHLIDPATHAIVSWSLMEGETFMAAGEGFQPGRVDLFVDNDTGMELTAAAIGADGKFVATAKWPVGVIGQHQILAREIVGPGTQILALVSVTVQMIPR